MAGITKDSFLPLVCLCPGLFVFVGAQKGQTSHNSSKEAAKAFRGDPNIRMEDIHSAEQKPFETFPLFDTFHPRTSTDFMMDKHKVHYCKEEGKGCVVLIFFVLQTKVIKERAVHLHSEYFVERSFCQTAHQSL